MIVVHMAQYCLLWSVRCWLQSHNAVVFSATNHDFRLPSRFVRGRRAARGRWPAGLGRYAGRQRLRAPASGLTGEERHSGKPTKVRRTDIPCVRDADALAPDTHGWVGHASAITRCRRRHAEWKKKTQRIREKGRRCYHTRTLSLIQIEMTFSQAANSL